METPSTSVVELLLVIQLAQWRGYSVVQLPILSQSNSTFKFNRWPKRRPSNISHMSSLAWRFIKQGMIDILCFCILGEAIRNRTGPGDDKTHENRKKRISFLMLVFQQKWCFNLRLFQIFMLMSPRNLFLVFVSFLVAMHFRLLLVTVVIHLKVNESTCDSFFKSKW